MHTHSDGPTWTTRIAAGLQTLPGSGYLDHALLTIVRARSSSTASPVHRLDRGTSGLVLFAKHPDAARAILKRTCESCHATIASKQLALSFLLVGQVLRD